jgi:hypothetical protein
VGASAASRTRRHPKVVAAREPRLACQRRAADDTAGAPGEHGGIVNDPKEHAMSAIVSLSRRVAGRAAFLAGAAWAADGVVQLVHSQRDTGSDVVGVAGYANLSLFAVALVLVSPALVALGELAGTPAARIAGRAAAAGTLVLGLTCVTSLVHGRDYGFFIVVAPLTNAAWLLGSIVLAVALWRTRTAPRTLAIGLPLAWIGTIPLATFGGGLLTGAYWMAVSLLLLGPARTSPVPVPATA